MFDTIDDILGGSSSAQMDDKSFREELIPVVKRILEQEFPNQPRRHNVKIFRDRLNFSCPICGDSAHTDSKKRGNIYLEGSIRNYYKCFNCGVGMSLNKFLGKFGAAGVMSSKASLYLYNTKNDYSFDVKVDQTSDILTEIAEIESVSIDREALKAKMGLMETFSSCAGKDYLISRKQTDFKRFLYSPYRNELYVLNLTPKGKILAFQVRNLNTEYKGPKYRSYSLSNIMKTFFNCEDVSMYEPYDTISMLFNALTVDYSRDVFVTEGPMDAFLIRNCIAACGGSKRIPLDVDLYYIYDYDEAGKKYSIEAINEGRKVFLWSKFANSIGLPPRNKWDWNDLVIYMQENNIDMPQHTEFFSNDPLDILSI